MTATRTADVARPINESEISEDVTLYGSFSDARLVELARHDDTAAFTELVRRYESRLMRVISRFISDVSIVEDLAQEVFLKVYRRLELFDASRRFGPWLFQVGVNMTLDHLRKTRRRIRWSLFSQKRDEDAPDLDPAAPDPREQLDLSQEVRKVLEMVPEKYRTVLVLRDLENFSTAEIAAILKRKEATIRWRLAEARTKFQRLWTARSNQQPLPELSEVNDDDLLDRSPTIGAACEE